MYSKIVRGEDGSDADLICEVKPDEIETEGLQLVWYSKIMSFEDPEVLSSKFNKKC